jgi:hypothetical protein
MLVCMYAYIYVYIYIYRRDDKIRSSMDMLQKRQKKHSIEMSLESSNESGPFKNKVYIIYIFVTLCIYIREHICLYIYIYVWIYVYLYGYIFFWSF